MSYLHVYWWTINVRHTDGKWVFLPAFAVMASSPELAFAWARNVIDSSGTVQDITGMWRTTTNTGEMSWNRSENV